MLVERLALFSEIYQMSQAIVGLQPQRANTHYRTEELLLTYEYENNTTSRLPSESLFPLRAPGQTRADVFRELKYNILKSAVQNSSPSKGAQKQKSSGSFYGTKETNLWVPGTGLAGLCL